MMLEQCAKEMPIVCMVFLHNMNKKVKSPYNCVISHLSQPQVANQQKNM